MLVISPSCKLIWTKIDYQAEPTELEDQAEQGEGRKQLEEVLQEDLNELTRRLAEVDARLERRRMIEAVKQFFWNENTWLGMLGAYLLAEAVYSGFRRR